LHFIGFICLRQSLSHSCLHIKQVRGLRVKPFVIKWINRHEMFDLFFLFFFFSAYFQQYNKESLQTSAQRSPHTIQAHRLPSVGLPSRAGVVATGGTAGLAAISGPERLAQGGSSYPRWEKHIILKTMSLIMHIDKTITSYITYLKHVEPQKKTKHIYVHRYKKDVY